MEASEKMLKALKSAATYLENSMLALNKEDENSFADSLWHVAAELEYALFLFSITIKNESKISKWKPNPEQKEIKTDEILVAVKNLLNESEKCMTNKKLLDAYKSVHIARHYVVKVQEDIAKRKREALKKK